MKRAIVKMFGERCDEYDKECATCLVYKMWDEIESLRKEKLDLQRKLYSLRNIKERFDYVCEENRKIAKLVTGTLGQ